MLNQYCIYFKHDIIRPLDILGFKSNSLFGKSIASYQKLTSENNDDQITHVGYVVTWDILNCDKQCNISDRKCRGRCRNMEDDRLYIMEAILDNNDEEKDIITGKRGGVLLRPLIDVLYSYESLDPKMRIKHIKWINPEKDINRIRYCYTQFHDKHHSRKYDDRLTSLLGTGSTTIKSLDNMIDKVNPNDSDFCSDLVTSMITRFKALPSDIDTKLVMPQHIYTSTGEIPDNFFTIGNELTSIPHVKKNKPKITIGPILDFDIEFNPKESMLLRTKSLTLSDSEDEVSKKKKRSLISKVNPFSKSKLN